MRIGVELLALGIVGLGVVTTGARAQTDPANKPVTVRVNWDKKEGTVPPAAYGLNLFQGAMQQNFENAKYKENIAYMAPGLVRFHHAGKMNDSKTSTEGLVDEKNQTWDKAKIAALLKGQRFAHRPQVLFNIPSWPKWMDADSDGFLDRDQWDNYAAFLADLVRIVNVRHKASVRYWEITNEWDGRYFTDFYEKGGWGELKDKAKPDRWDEVAEIYNRCARAMKAVDPTIKTGGPAMARPDLIMAHERFAKATLPNLDFFSIHAYASGSRDTPDSEIYDKAEGMGKYVVASIALLKKISPNKHIPVILSEFNISWTWETRDPRMTNHKGGVFDALTYIATTKAGAFSAQAWNEKDGIYGKTDGEDNKRPGALVLNGFNRYATGERVQAESSDTKRVATYATVDNRQKTRTVVFVNRSNSEQTVQSSAIGEVKDKYFVYLISDGMVGIPHKSKPTMNLPPHSVTFLVSDPTASR